MLIRTEDGPAFIYRIDQRWVKNNRDLENIVFGTAGKEHDQLIYDDIACLLGMAIADKVLAGFDTIADLQKQKIPRDKSHIMLRFKREILDKPILRKCTMFDGVTEKPMTRAAFNEIFSATLRNAGYTCATSVHAIRRQLRKKVDELYTEAQRS